ncbi:MAG TPA: hypothetical protein VG147_02725 [Solirubrobacteraceae bacterium]|nr:hypothetical protein [Solirubrobacteraceae bacterium]
MSGVESRMSEAAITRREQRRAGLVWAPEVRGTLCHRLIAEICVCEITDTRSIEALAAAMLPAGLAPVYRQALLTFLVPMAGSYLRHFSRPGWRFLGSEVIVGPIALDLLWQHGSRLEADEVKSSASTPTLWRDAAQAQAAAQARAGRRHFGEAFAGVRIAALALGESVWVTA